ncbi:MAG: hypothetical protein JRC86_01505 [Deltaproteobacteria bacterium]|nr:hypothetical protein [Deltaproteobacteria bacterium]
MGFVRRKEGSSLGFLRAQIAETAEDVRAKILSKLFKDGTLEVTSDTDFEEFRDWERLLRPVAEKEGAIIVRPLDLVDLVEHALESLCRKIASTDTDYPATWEGYSSVELYYCTRPFRGFVVHETHTDGDFSGVRFNVHKNARSAVRSYNSTIDSWIDTLLDHSTLDVPGAEESEERAEELKHERLKVREVLEKIRRLL